MHLCRRLVSLLTVLLLATSATLLRGQAYTNIVVFGDSLSDTGNFARLSANAYNLRIPGPLANYTDGRFTDGITTSPAAQLYNGIWIEQLAATLAARPVIKASLDGGTDYAYGSATNNNGTQVVTYGPSNGLSVTVNNVGQQITTYLATNPTITSNTLFVVWAGANDLLNATSGAAIVAAGQQDIVNVQRLINAGATNILVPNLPPLGAIPRLNQSPAASATATAGAAGYNAVVAAGLAGLPAANPTKTLRLFLLDAYSLFSSVLVAPQPVFGLVNVTNSSQGLTINPDTYTFWDDLHPTTAVHRLLSIAARNLLTETAASTTTLTLGAANAIPGQVVTLKAVVAPAIATITSIPTGVVTFYSGSTPLVSVPLDNTGTASANLPSPAASTTAYAITASYGDDSLFTSSTSAAQSLTVLSTPVATTTVLSTSSLTPNLGASVVLTATVSSVVAAPGGNVQFLDGATVLATVPLAAGSASFTTTTLASGTHVIKATYAGTTTYATSSSATLSEVVTSPAYTLIASPTTLTATAGAGASTTLTLTPVGGYTGTFTLACGAMPAHASCTFSSPTLVASGNNVASASSLSITTYANATVAALTPVSHPNLQIFAALAFLPCLGSLALIGRRRRQLRSLWIGVALLGLGSIAGITGCSSAPALHYTPAGSYQVPVNVSSGGATVSTINLTFVVQ